MPSDTSSVGPSRYQPPHAAPATFTTHAYERTYVLPFRQALVWEWLNDPRTFTDGQVWPWRVEFVAPREGAPDGFAPGVLNVHHGPGMCFAGMLGAIEPPDYRDLQYFYGSYFLSMRLIRPTRLQFWLEPTDGGTRLRMRLDSYVKPWLHAPWTWAQDVFWQGFGRWITGALRVRLRDTWG